VRELFEGLFEYNLSVNDGLIGIASGHADEALTRQLSHIINAHGIWNARILGTTPPFTVWQVLDTADLPSHNAANHELTTQILAYAPLSELISYTNSRGESYRNLARDILFHILNHSTHHRALVSARLRALGIVPPSTDYIFYKR
jgi:uncharacterized damage-inducible protein DinB